MKWQERVIVFCAEIAEKSAPRAEQPAYTECNRLPHALNLYGLILCGEIVFDRSLTFPHRYATTMRKINVCLFQPPGYIHSEGLIEAAQFFVEKARKFGCDTSLTKNRLDYRSVNILLCYHAYLAAAKDNALPPLPARSIIFNSEQLAETGAWFNNSRYTEALRENYVWDYSASNIARHGGREKSAIFFNHCPSLRRIDQGPKDIDLLFYGCMNDRRQKILRDLSDTGLKIVTVNGLYGRERDKYLSRCRGVLSLHFYEHQILPQIRCFYPLTNGIPVVSEHYGKESAPGFYQDCLFSPRDDEDFVEYVSDLMASGRFEQESRRKYDYFRSTEKLDDELREIFDRALKFFAVAPAAPYRPGKINLGSGRNYIPGYLNIDINPNVLPDSVVDVSAIKSLPMTLETTAYGAVELAEGVYDEILATDVFEHVPNLADMMLNCLKLLKDGGELKILAPHDLGTGAWQDPTHIRAFNENSWLYYTDWSWYLGWFDYRFDCVSMSFNLSTLGNSMVQEGRSLQDISRTPRAVDSLNVTLKKRATTESERQLAKSYSAAWQS